MDYQKDAEDETIYSGPRAGLIYKVSDTLALKYLYNSTKRRPQANEITGSVVSPELLEAHELIGMLDISSKLKLDVTLFTQKLQDEITRANDPLLLNAFYNTGGITTKGIEWAFKYLSNEKLLIYWNGSYLDAKVNKKVINGVTLAEAHNSDDEPLFVPEFTSFLGAELMISQLLRVNCALRTITEIPYLTETGEEDYASVNFVDLTVRTKKFFNNRLEADLVVLNMFDNDNRVPAFGEHAGNTNGTLAPEGRKYYLKAIVNF